MFVSVGFDSLVAVEAVAMVLSMSGGSSSSNVTFVAKADRVAFGFENFNTVLSLWRSQYSWIAALISAGKYLYCFPCTTFRSTSSK